MRISTWLGIAALTLTAASGCTRSDSTDVPASKPSSQTHPFADPAAKAEIGKPAPLFTLPDESGKPTSLASFRGKIVVLEWFNPECPFVKASHEKGSLVGAAKDAEGKGIAWLAINSGGPGRQGHGASKNAEAKKNRPFPTPSCSTKQETSARPTAPSTPPTCS